MSTAGAGARMTGEGPLLQPQPLAEAVVRPGRMLKSRTIVRSAVVGEFDLEEFLEFHLNDGSTLLHPPVYAGEKRIGPTSCVAKQFLITLTKHTTELA